VQVIGFTFCDIVFLLQSAVGWDYQAQLAKHQSQTDAAKGFGGRYGVQKERQDKVSTVALIELRTENVAGGGKLRVSKMYT